MWLKSKKPPRVIVYIIADVLVLLTVLSVFGWIGLVPKKSLSALSQSTKSAEAEMLSATPSPESPSATPTATPTASPVPATGDFSSTFARAVVKEDADFIYRSDDYVITVDEVYVGEAVALVADVYIRDIHSLKTAFAFNSFKGIYAKNEDILELCKRNNAIFAVSGDFISIREDGTVIRNGEILQMNKYNDICVLRTDGTMSVYGLRGITRDQLSDGTVWQAWCFGPNLLDENGNAKEVLHNLMRLNPRCAIGYYEPGHYCFVIVDGRQKYYSVGMTLTELSSFMASLGCKVAYNLDGGQTAQMVLDEALVNMPANGGRKVGDIIYIEKADDHQ